MSQATAAATAASYTHCLCPRVSAPSPAPRILASLLIPLAVHEFLREKSGNIYVLATPPRSRFSQEPMVASPPGKSHIKSFVRQTLGPVLGTAPARSPWGFRYHGTLRRQTPTSEHACFRAGNREERGRTQHARNPATLPLKNPQPPHGVRHASVRGPWSRHRLENPTVKALFARPRAKPLAGCPPAARGGSVIMGPRGASGPPVRAHTLGLGTGKSGGEPSMLTTPPRSRSRTPIHRMAFATLQSGAYGRVTA